MSASRSLYSAARMAGGAVAGLFAVPICDKVTRCCIYATPLRSLRGKTGKFVIERRKVPQTQLLDEYRTLLPRMEQLLLELDRLHLGTVAVHVDLALRKLEEIITLEAWADGNLNGQ